MGAVLTRMQNKKSQKQTPDGVPTRNYQLPTLEITIISLLNFIIIVYINIILLLEI